MGLFDQIIDDLAEITSGDASIDIQALTADGITFTIPGFHAKHHLGINPDTGLPINSKKVCIAFSEKNCTKSIRKDGEVHLKGWRFRCKDSTGVIKLYKADQWFPDETVGLIVVILTICAD